MDGYRGALPLIDRLPFDATGIAVKPWYRPEETTSPALLDTCYHDASLPSPDGPKACAVTRSSDPESSG